MTDLQTSHAESPAESLVGATSRGSSELAKLFHDHNASLVSLLRARLRSDQEARDVAQEAYVRLLQLERVDTISFLRAYLFRTALNIATDRLRSGAMRVATFRDPVFDPRVNEISPERVVVAEDELRTVAATLDTLPPKARYAFLLHRFADLDIDEVAKRLHVSERMVRKYIVQALLRFRAAIDDVRAKTTEKQSGMHEH
jgi:RNA polymerase sigma-70 factor (ECF subfamily)